MPSALRLLTHANNISSTYQSIRSAA